MKNTLKLCALYFGLGISSVFAMDPQKPYSSDCTSQSQQTQLTWDTFIMPNFPFIHGTFQEGTIKLYTGILPFQEYDTSLLRNSTRQTNKNQEYNRFKNIINILFDSKTNTIYVHGDSLCSNDYPLLKITMDSVTELFEEDIVTKIYQDNEGNIHAWTIPSRGSLIMNDIQLNNQQVTQQLHFYDAWRLFSNQPQRPKL